MRAELRAKISVTQFAIMAELAFFEKRAEISVLLENALRQEGKLVKANVQGVLPGLSDTAADNVIGWCRDLGLVELDGALTLLGVDVASTQRVPVPEQGLYWFQVITHPLSGVRPLAVDRMKSSRAGAPERASEPPTLPKLGLPYTEVLNERCRFVIRKYLANSGVHMCVRAGEGGEALCEIVWQLQFLTGSNSWHLEGRLPAVGNGVREIAHEPESAQVNLTAIADVWGSSVLGRLGSWDSTERRLLVSFRDVQTKELDTFTRDLSLADIEVSGFGKFDRCVLWELPIGPATDKDARDWAATRLDTELKRTGVGGRYWSRGELICQHCAVVDGTPLEKHRPPLASHQELLARYRNTPELYWAIAAAVDLAPYPPSEVDLGEFKPGATQVRESRAIANGSFVVPYKGGWSMDQLVVALLGGTKAKRVLLCDRYVRGDKNLRLFRLFHDALSARLPKCALDVWTEKDGANLELIKQVTGEQGRDYLEVFGTARPHDRYVLMTGEAGVERIWQLTNSPLSAEMQSESDTYKSPLGWKGLAGVLLEMEQAMPEFRRWLKGR